jgi:hypothetical protein
MTQYVWRGPAILPHPAVDTTNQFIGGVEFVAATESEAIRQATEFYNSTVLGNLGIHVEIARDEEEMRTSSTEEAPKVIRLYRDRQV